MVPLLSFLSSQMNSLILCYALCFVFPMSYCFFGFFLIIVSYSVFLFVIFNLFNHFVKIMKRFSGNQETKYDKK